MKHAMYSILIALSIFISCTEPVCLKVSGNLNNCVKFYFVKNNSDEHHISVRIDELWIRVYQKNKNEWIQVLHEKSVSKVEELCCKNGDFKYVHSRVMLCPGLLYEIFCFASPGFGERAYGNIYFRINADGNIFVISDKYGLAREIKMIQDA